MNSLIEKQIKETIGVLEQVARDPVLLESIQSVAQACCAALKRGNKVLLAGNGGSAADAQHFAGEFVGRFAYDRPGLCALSLATDTTVLTAIGNDYGYERIFARQIEAVGAAGDVFIGISTSGRSKNVVEALRQCRTQNILTVGLVGASGGDMLPLCDHGIRVPSTSTQNIQEAHGVIGHIICSLVETEMFPQGA